MARPGAAVPAWAATADHRQPVLLDQVDDEEAILLVLAAEHITEEERACLSHHLLTNTPKLALCGLVLEDANLAERAVLRSALPAPVRGIRHVIGRPRYARHVSRVRAT
ncbi:hypothetical protein [Streptomyces sp. NRRL S-646]|uniref:hypothetical protein n=1 Tax=Streptomyces sp. NRRL S-646 TaxID=1463917 RepID=UPI00068DA1B3|nr:hypothetical protein [Streptomyces sp. NRRL S-646]